MESVERSTILAEALTVVTTAKRSLDVTALHHHNHRNHLAFVDEVIHDVLHVALSAPACLVLTHAMLQVEHGVLLFALLIFSRCIDHGVTPLVGGVGKVVDAAYLSVGDAELRAVVVALRSFGNLNAAGLAVASEERVGVRVDDVDTTYINKVIVEANYQGVGHGTPDTRLVLAHVILLAADIYLYLIGCRGVDTEVVATLTVYLRKFLSGNSSSCCESIGRYVKRRMYGIAHQL